MSPFLKAGNAVRFFLFVFFVSGSVSFVVFLPFFFSEGCCLEKFSGANFCFWVSVWVLRVLVLFCLCFCFIICFFAPETVLKNSIDVRSGLFWLSSFFLWFFRRRRRLFFFSFFKRDSSGSNRARPHTHLFCLSLFLFLSRRICLFALFGRASCFLVFSLGCHSGPHAFLGFPWYSSEALSLDARRQGRFGRFLLLFSFSPSVVFCGCFHTN